MTGAVVIGLSAVVMGVRGGEIATLTVRSDGPRALPAGPFDPASDRTFELALRAFVTQQTGFELGYVEQLYTFGDKGRDAPLADLGGDAGPGGARVVSVGYLALTPTAGEAPAIAADWAPWNRFFPYEDWRRGRPAVLDEAVVPALLAWAEGHSERQVRVRLLFALDGARWNEERVLERYELLYEAGLAPEAERDRARVRGESDEGALVSKLGEPMASDHRRILATALGRLRGKLKYRPVVFELMPPTFTLSSLQKTVEAVSGVPLHKQNFRRMIVRTGLVEGLGRLEPDTGGRPAELFRFRRDGLVSTSAPGLSLPLA